MIKYPKQSFDKCVYSKVEHKVQIGSVVFAFFAPPLNNVKNFITQAWIYHFVRITKFLRLQVGFHN